MQGLAFILVITILIFVHEFGHFIFAKLFNVKVVKFSIGMGPEILKYQGKETKYVISVIPIGGFVSMLGHDPSIEQTEEDKGRSLNDKSNWQRFLIMVAGPVFNLILPFFLYFIYAILTTTHLSSQVGQVSINSPAHEAKLQSGDIITSIDNHKIKYWSDISRIVSNRPGKKMPVSYIRSGKAYKTQLTATKEENTDKIKTSEFVGKLGITPYLDSPIIFFNNETNLIKSFDLITKINGKKIKSTQELYKFKNTEKIDIELLRPIALNTNIFDFYTLETVILKQVSTDFIKKMLNPDMAIWWVHPGSVAKKAGFKKGDYILSVNGKKFKYWAFLRHYLTKQKDKNEITFKILRNNQEIEIKATQELVKGERVTQSSYYELGISTYFIKEASNIVPYIKSKTPFSDAISEMMYQTTHMTSLVFKSVIALVTGNISFDHLGGPIMMYEASGIALSYGWLSLLKLMAILSINLGLLNLLPIPMLDGGHILFIIVETIRRKPVNQKFKEVVSFIGIMILITVMILVFKNDIENFIFK